MKKNLPIETMNIEKRKSQYFFIRINCITFSRYSSNVNACCLKRSSKLCSLIVHFYLQITFFVEVIRQLPDDGIILQNYKHGHFELHEWKDKNADLQYLNHYLIDGAILRNLLSMIDSIFQYNNESIQKKNELFLFTPRIYSFAKLLITSIGILMSLFLVVRTNYVNTVK